MKLPICKKTSMSHPENAMPHEHTSTALRVMLHHVDVTPPYLYVPHILNTQLASVDVLN